MARRLSQARMIVPAADWSYEIVAAAIQRFVDENPPEQPSPPSRVVATDVLSSREVEVLRLLAAGRSNAQIAEELVISLNTVNRHVSNIYAKTGAANRAEAASYATRSGIAS